MSVLRADLFSWFLLLSAVVSGGFVLLALDNDGRTLAWCAAVLFALISLVAVGRCCYGGVRERLPAVAFVLLCGATLILWELSW